MGRLWNSGTWRVILYNTGQKWVILGKTRQYCVRLELTNSVAGVTRAFDASWSLPVTHASDGHQSPNHHHYRCHHWPHSYRSRPSIHRPQIPLQAPQRSSCSSLQGTINNLQSCSTWRQLFTITGRLYRNAREESEDEKVKKWYLISFQEVMIPNRG